jgi:hypothetical protein
LESKSRRWRARELSHFKEFPMPHTTHAYWFELKVCEFAARLSETLTGEQRAFLIVFGEDGAALSLTFEPPRPPGRTA